MTNEFTFEFKEIYVTQTTDMGGQVFQSGHSYALLAQDAELLMQRGHGEEIVLPSIASIKDEADRIAHEYDKKRKELQQSPRYAENETERQYLLKEMDDYYSAKMNEYNFNLRAEIAALKSVEASQALSFVGNAGDIEKAKQTAEAIVTQMQIAVSPQNILDLIELSVSSFSDAEKIEVLKRFGEIKALAGDKEKQKVERIEKALRSVENPHLKRIKWIKALEASGVKASTKYNNMKPFLKGGAFE